MTAPVWHCHGACDEPCRLLPAQRGAHLSVSLAFTVERRSVHPMELPGHVGVALLVYAPFAAIAIRSGRSRQAWLGMAVVLALAMSPDVDLYLAGVPHRGLTHTVLAAIAVGGSVALLAAVARLLRSRGSGAASAFGSTAGASRFGATVGGLGVLSHLVGDVITPMGIRPFLPVSGTTYTLSLVYAADQRANVALLVAGIAVFATAVSLARSPVPTGVQKLWIRRSREI